MTGPLAVLAVLAGVAVLLLFAEVLRPPGRGRPVLDDSCACGECWLPLGQNRAVVLDTRQPHIVEHHHREGCHLHEASA